MFQIGFQHLADIVLRAANHAAQAAPAAVDMLGGGIDDHIGAKFDRLGEGRRGKDIVDDHGRADAMGNVADRFHVDNFKCRVRHRFEKHRLGALAHRGAPLIQIGAVHQRDIDPETAEDLKDIET